MGGMSNKELHAETKSFKKSMPWIIKSIRSLPKQNSIIESCNITFESFEVTMVSLKASVDDLVAQQASNVAQQSFKDSECGIRDQRLKELSYPHSQVRLLKPIVFYE